MTLAEETERLEKQRILEAVYATRSFYKAAEPLGIAHSTVYRKMREWGITTIGQIPNALEALRGEKNLIS